MAEVSKAADPVAEIRKRHFSEEAAEWPIESLLAHPWVHLGAVHTYECPATKWGRKTKGHIHGPCNCGAAEVQNRLDAHKLELAMHPPKKVSNG